MKRPTKAAQVLLIAGLLSFPCVGLAGMNRSSDPPMPEHILVQPEKNRYKVADVGVFRFGSPKNTPGVGYTAARIFYNHLLLNNLFYSVSPELAYTTTSTRDQIQIADKLRLRVLITGRIIEYMAGDRFRKSRLRQEFMAILVPSGEILWHAETVATGGGGALLADLLSENAQKFINLLRRTP